MNREDFEAYQSDLYASLNTYLHIMSINDEVTVRDVLNAITTETSPKFRAKSVKYVLRSIALGDLIHEKKLIMIRGNPVKFKLEEV